MDLKSLLIQTTINKGADGIVSDNISDNVDKGVSEGLGEGLSEGLGEGLGEGLSEGLDNELSEGLGEGVGDADEIDLDSRFKLPWNKLEKGMKMNRILLYVKKETEEKELSNTIAKELKSILFNACDRGLFNKISEVKYDTEIGEIESFKCLEFNELTKKYKLKSTGPKNRSVSKSRSNIDRLVKKK